MQRSAVRTFGLVAWALVSSAASAAPVRYFGYMSGAAENPANASPASGFALVTVDEIARTLSVSVTFSGLLAPDTAAHIHCCTTEPMNIGVATRVPTFAAFPDAATSGTYANTFTTTDPSTYNPTFVTVNGSIAVAEAVFFAGIAAGNAYFDIHSSFYPGGEIRSFLHPDSIFGNGMESP